MSGACTPAADSPLSPTLTPISVPAATGSSAPNLARSEDGTVILSWLEPTSDGHALRYSTLGDAGWQETGTVAEGSNWFVNWADFPSVVPLGGALRAAHWLVKQPGGMYAYDIAIAVSTDAGETWSEPLTPHTDATPTDHGFVSLYRQQDRIGEDRIGAIWLDGRTKLNGGAGMSLRSATLNSDGILEDGQLLDELVCDCCQTDATLGADGPVVVYRDRSPLEVRDISIARQINGRWQKGMNVAEDGWKISGCPVNGPAIDAYGESLAVAWFTMAAGIPRVQIAFSADAGSSFGTARAVSSGAALGRSAVSMISATEAVVAWFSDQLETTGLNIRHATASGNFGPIYEIAETGTGRPAGFPQMQLVGDELLIAWTDTRENQAHIRSALIPLAELSASVR